MRYYHCSNECILAWVWVHGQVSEGQT